MSSTEEEGQGGGMGGESGGESGGGMGGESGGSGKSRPAPTADSRTAETSLPSLVMTD
jgi:hypothetical protein